MWVRRLRLHEFRNHVESVLDLLDGPVVISGPNGSGKTSILEAVHLLAAGRSFRTSDEASLLRTGSSRGIVEADAVVAGRGVRIGVAMGDVGHRFVLNGAPRRTHRDVALIRSVVFSPDDLSLVKGPPSERREYVDDALVSVSPSASLVLSEWARVLRQRNVLLRSLRGKRQASATAALETWSGLLADKGAELVASRFRLLEELRPHFVRAVQDLAGLESSMSYEASWDTRGEEPESSEEIAAVLTRRLQERSRDELERGVTLVGPHRDDLALTIDGRDVRSRASQGEQRVVSLALRLAHLGVLTDVLAEQPILLLDDVMSELDPDRRARLLERLPKAQTLITTTAAADATGPPPDLLGALAAAGMLDSGAPLFVRVAEGKVVADVA